VSGPVFDTSIFAMQPPSAAVLSAYGQASQQLATNLMTAWNLYAGSTDAQIVQGAASILASFQDTVRQVGTVARPALAKASPGLAAAIAQGPSTDAQAQLIAGIEGAQILAKGILQVAYVGADGSITSFTDLATYTKQVAEKVGNVTLSPWLWISAAVIAASAAAVAVVYTVHTSGVLTRVAELPPRR
jgi:hypothetical protein